MLDTARLLLIKELALAEGRDEEDIEFDVESLFEDD